MKTIIENKKTNIATFIMYYAITLLMCLAIPGKIVKIEGNVALVDYGEVIKEVRIDFVPDVKEGDYVIVHTGFAIEKMDEDSARKSIEAWEELLGEI